MTPVSGAGSAMFVAENISCGLTKYYKVSEFTLSQEPLQSLVNLFFRDISTDSSGSRNQENDFSCMKIFWRKWPQTRTPNKCPESSVTSHPLIKLGHTFSQHPCPVSGTAWNHVSSPDSPRAYWTAGRLGPSTQCHVPLHVKLFASWKVLRDPSKQVLRCVERSVPQKAPRFFFLVTRSFLLRVFFWERYVELFPLRRRPGKLFGRGLRCVERSAEPFIRITSVMDVIDRLRRHMTS